MIDLYHFTSTHHLTSIMADGIIRTTESNLAGPDASSLSQRKLRRQYCHSRLTRATEPQVVWLSKDPVPDTRYLGAVDGRNGQPIKHEDVPPEWQKARVRITVSLPDADVAWWPKWARESGIKEPWYQMLAHQSNPKLWYVVLRSIALSEVVAIHIDDEQVWPQVTQADLARMQGVLG